MLTAFLVDSLADVVASDSTVTLREALTAANTNIAVYDAPAGSSSETDVIVFNAALFTDGANPVPRTITLGGTQLGIADPAGLEVYGPGAPLLTIHAGQLSRVFSVSENAVASLSSLTVAGGAIDEPGGGIRNSGGLTLSHCVLSGNHGTLGGAVSVAGGTLTVNNSTLSANSAEHYGGGIYGTGTITVSDSVLTLNQAAMGGAIFASDDVVLHVLDSTIADNSATEYGGGIHSDSDSGYPNITIERSDISSNSAGQGGGGINFMADAPSLLAIVDSTLSANRVTDGDGGAIYSTGTLTLTRSTLSGNSTSGEYKHGGAVYTRGVLTLTDSVLAENHSSFGGAVGVAGGTLTVNNSTLSANSAEHYGGGIYGTGTITVSDSVLTLNQAATGGAIFASDDVVLHVLDSTIADNSATEYGGGIHSDSDSGYPNITIERSDISSNSAGQGGGGINFMADAPSLLAIVNSTLLHNSADANGYGGAIYSTGTLTLTNSTLSNNSATGTLSSYGGGIWSSGAATLNNTIAAQNAASSGPDVYYSSGTLSGSYNLIGDGSGQTALVDGVAGNQVGTSAAPVDPRLTSSGELSAASPAVNAGSNALALHPQGDPLTVDRDGKPRVLYTTVDIGAYEFHLVADPDCSGTVGAADAQILAGHWGLSGMTWIDGDLNQDGIVNAADAAILAANWGATVNPSAEGDPPLPATLDVPDVQSTFGQRVTVPVTMARNGNNVFGIDFVLSYDETALAIVSAVPSAGQSEMGHIINTDVPGQVSAALWDADYFEHDGPLVDITFDVIGTLAAPADIDFEYASLNEDAVAVMADDGAVLDTIAPVVAVPAVNTPDSTPALAGTVNDPYATLIVTVNGTSYPATNLGDGTWTLPDNTISPPLAAGRYPILLDAVDLAGNPASASAMLYVALPGDADFSGTVGADDAQRLAVHWGLSGMSWADGDFNGDGRVNASDASIMAANWGATVDPPPEAALAPPTAPTAAPVLGPMPRSLSSPRHSLERTADRVGQAVPDSAMPEAASVAQATPDSSVPEMATVQTPLRSSRLRGEEAADAALTQQYGPLPAAATLARTRTLARRHSPQAVDLILASPDA